MTKVSIVVPARNEEETLGNVLDDLKQTILQMPAYEFELICVDGHSTG